MSSDKKGVPETKISVKPASPADKPVRRSFPGPRGAASLLRVTVARNAYAELIVHAKESLDAEVCGVLVGHVCEDDQGVFVSVEAIIRGAAANQGSTHVTFTQATWNSIHKTLENDYSDLRMVGWYHTHPGFGVEFSDMDLFIQKNFFSGPAQIALVTDPLNGDVAICVNQPAGPQYLDQFWVDGREQACKKPAPKPAAEKTGAAAASPVSGSEGDVMTAIRSLESRVSQLLQAMDDQRATFYRFLLSIGMLFCVALLIAVYFFIQDMYIARNEPPKNMALLPISLEIEGKPVLLGLQVSQWAVPPELNYTMLQVERERQEALAKMAADTNLVATNAVNPESSTPNTNGSK